MWYVFWYFALAVPYGMIVGTLLKRCTREHP